MPAGAQAEVKTVFWQLFDDDGPEPGQEAVDTVRRRIAAFETTYGTAYPAAVKCLLSDVESLTVYLRFPKEHWKRIRHSNFIERTFGETRRRVKVIGRLRVSAPARASPGPCSTGRDEDGAACSTTRRRRGCSPSCAVSSSSRRSRSARREGATPQTRPLQPSRRVEPELAFVLFYTVSGTGQLTGHLRELETALAAATRRAKDAEARAARPERGDAGATNSPATLPPL